MKFREKAANPVNNFIYDVDEVSRTTVAVQSQKRPSLLTLEFMSKRYLSKTMALQIQSY